MKSASLSLRRFVTLAAALGNLNAQAAPLSETLRFSSACEPHRAEVTVAAVGDLLLHSPLQRQASALIQEGGFTTLWNHVQPWLDQADIRFANLEGPISPSKPKSSYPQFNYASELAPALRESGFSVLSTANNHALDQGSRGADETLSALEFQGLPHMGSRRKTDTTDQGWSTVTEARGFRLAWVACTFSTNGITDRYHQVLDCYRDESILMSKIRELSQNPMIDAVLVAPHWGVEYQFSPEKRERDLARRMLEAGALAVIGGHPHVLQPMEKHVINGKERFVLYSLGNFVSGQPTTQKRTSTILFMKLTRTRAGETVLAQVRTLPLLMTTRNGRIGVSPAGDIQNEFGAAALKLHGNVLNPNNQLHSNRSLQDQFEAECLPEVP